MSTIHGDGDKQLSKTTINNDTISETEVGSQQQTSAENLVTTITEKYPIRFRNIPILGRLHGLYREYSIKTEHIKILEQTFVDQAMSKGISEDTAHYIYNDLIKNHLSQKSPKEVQHFETFIKDKAGAAFFCTLVFANKEQPKVMNQRLKEAVKRAILAQGKNPEKCKELFDTFNRMGSLFNTLDSKTRYLVFNYLLSKLALPSDDKKSITIDTALENLNTFADFAESNNLHNYLATKKEDKDKTKDEKYQILNSVLQQNLTEDLGHYQTQPEQLAKILDSIFEFPPTIERTPFHDVLANKTPEEKIVFLKYSLTSEGHQQLSEALKTNAPQALSTAVDTALKTSPKEDSPLSPYLQKLSAEQLEHLTHFALSDSGFNFLNDVQQVYKENPKKIEASLSLAIEVVKKGNIESLNIIFEKIPAIEQIIDRLQPIDKVEFKEALVAMAARSDYRSFFTFARSYQSFIQRLEELQAARPRVFGQDSDEREELQDLVQTRFAEQARLLDNDERTSFGLLNKTLLDVTVLRNPQLTQYSVMGFYSGPSLQTVRTIPLRTHRISDFGREAPYSLTNQFLIPFTLPKDQDADPLPKNFNPKTEIFITDPLSLATRSVVLGLPIDKTITIGEARKQLEYLHAVVGTFDEKTLKEKYKELQLPPEKEDKLTSRFKKFSIELDKKLGEALADFNATKTRPRYANINEDEVMEYSIDSMNTSDSQGSAIFAAKMRNLFVLEGGALSLLPPTVAEQHSQIATLSPSEIEGASKQLLEGKEKSDIALPESMDKKAQITSGELAIKFEPVSVNNNPFYSVEVEITHNGQSTKRQFFHDVTEGSAEEIKKKITQNRELEREILLTKAAFMDEHVR